MKKLFWRALVTVPVFGGAMLFAASNTLAQILPTSDAIGTDRTDGMLEQLNQYNLQEDAAVQTEMSQVTNVNQLRDVSPTDWAFEALRSLVERYGCIAGYPNQTYRGNQAMTRYEFAAGLNACLNQIERLIASSEAVAREDIETLQRLTQEFEAELATLGGRVDNLEGRVAFLEDTQFSTTTKLNGEVIFTLADAFGNSVDTDEDETQAAFGSRTRLNFDTSFTGQDRLRTRLQAGNVPRLDQTTGTSMARLGFDANNDNDVVIDKLYYSFPVGEQITAYVGTVGMNIDNIFDVNNPELESGALGALSRFSRRNPLVLRGAEGTGGGLTYQFTDQLKISALYLADGGDASDPSEGAGFFNGSFSAGGQIVFSPIDTVDVAFTYVRSYQTPGNVNLSGSTSSPIAQDPFDGASAATANRFGLGANWSVTEKIVLAGWGGYADARAKGGTRSGDNAKLFTWSANVSLLDLGKEGATFSVAGGTPPKAYDVDGGPDDDNTSFLIEALYKYPLNDNILITPGAYVILNPNHDNNNDTIVVGAIRTTFRF